MKNKSAVVTSCIFSLLLSLGILSCYSSAFDITVNTGALVISSVIFSVLLTLVCSFIKNAKKFLISIAVISAVFLVVVIASYDTLLGELTYSLNQVLYLYSKYLSVQSSVSFGSLTSAYNASALFVALSFLLILLFTLFLCKVKAIWPVSIITILTLIPCFVLVNTLPDIFPLITVVVVSFTLYITSFFQRRNIPHGGIISAFAGVLMLSLVLGIYALNPPQSYERAEWQDRLLEQAENLTGMVNGSQNNILSYIKSLGSSFSETEDLENVGPLTQTHEQVMSVRTDYSGSVLLKGTAYANYNDNEWSISDKEQINSFPSAAKPFDSGLSEGIYEIEIATKNQEAILYTPYFLSDTLYDSTICGDICIKNDMSETSFVWKYNPYSESRTERYKSQSDGSQISEKYREYVYDNYLQLPESTRESLLKIVEENGLAGLNDEEIPSAVKEYVSSVGSYSLNAQKMPDGEDFAVWFLTESDTGYCVHYATATALMLRALGIPSRYVTGYLCSPTSEEWALVTSDDAHAWAEYFDENLGWVPLDATPALASSSGGAETETVSPATDSTQPEYDQEESVTVQDSTAAADTELAEENSADSSEETAAGSNTASGANGSSVKKATRL